MFHRNPNLIQPPFTPLSTTRPPLFLLHDGGGTIYAYYCLSDLHRPVYGIFNPHYSRKSTFEGGVPEMGKTYLGFIVDTLFGDDQCDGKVSSSRVRVRPGTSKAGTGTTWSGKEEEEDRMNENENENNERDLILGGWSQGGMTSLEVARKVLDFNAAEAAAAAQKTGKQARKLNVLGIVMIDSMNPSPSSYPHDVKIANPNATTMLWGPHTKPETKEAVSRCFYEARRITACWEMPTWPSAAAAAASEDFEGSHDGESTCKKMGPPPVVLLRAKEYVPLQEEQVATGEVSRTDVHRKDELLGWGKYAEGMVRKVIHVEGNHFNLFTDAKRAEMVTRRVREACEFLEGLWKQGKDGGMR
ncbi:hypothetical protein QBC32DRAFT_327179 [Pseudoneurospora amorphoporcata]|uniref:Thioesterase domain-containing protein n=1 Tax=Pseudoneurospora amorphoporcata TaxID=241081 RepID=A0AAN6SDP0_9PEZI|nr:hypothetical protein QBC32DRAFT_327179 [Pseudoneurospora amorphoporcata]